jgi:phosphoribosylaminoimidazole-succinocarboxamide synthase
MASGEKLDKDRFRRDLGGEEEANQEVARRLGLLQDDASGPGEVFDLSAHRSKLRTKSKPKK